MSRRVRLSWFSVEREEWKRALLEWPLGRLDLSGLCLLTCSPHPLAPPPGPTPWPQAYITFSDRAFAAATVQAIGRVACSISEVTETCLHGLMSLLSNKDGVCVCVRACV